MKLKKEDYKYLGTYHTPLLYACLCRNWFIPKLAKNMPQIKGELLVLDGEQFYLKSDWEKIKSETLKAIKDNDKFFIDFFKLSKQTINKIEKLARGKIKIEELYNAVHEMEFPWYLILPMAEAVEEYVAIKLKEENRLDELQSFFQPIKKTLIMKQQEELRNLSKNKISKHVKKYEWLGMMHFWGKPFTEEECLLQLKTIKLKQKYKTYSCKGKKWERLKKITANLTYYRQRFAEVCAIASLANYKRLGKDYELFLWCTPEEILTGKLSLKIIKERQKAFGLHKNKILIGSELKKAIKKMLNKQNKIKIFTGQVACRGLVKGKVKIILTPKDISKFKRGDILVSPETTPDFMQALSKSSAVVTDMGGLTCHAAIVARELNKPCIIGTKIATKVLKDGDYIEVDANKGIVKILKH